MASETLFFGPNLEIYSDSVADTSFSRGDQAVFSYTDQILANYSQTARYSMLASDSHNITIPGTAAADSQLLLIKVNGAIHVTTTAVDFDNSTPIVGHLVCQGTNIFQGILILATYNVTALTLVADVDSTVEIYSSILA